MSETGMEPIEESFGAHGTSVHVWPDGIEGSGGRAFGVLTATELYSDGAREAIRLEAEARCLTVSTVLGEWETELDTATMWLEARGLEVQWDSPHPLPQQAKGVCLRSFFVNALDRSETS